MTSVHQGLSQAGAGEEAGYEVGFYTQQQFKTFRSLQAYNQMVSGFITSVQGISLATSFLLGQRPTLLYYSLTFHQREICHWISGESRVSIANIHAVIIRETVNNEMAKQYAKSWNAMFSLLSFIDEQFFRLFSFINNRGYFRKNTSLSRPHLEPQPSGPTIKQRTILFHCPLIRKSLWEGHKYGGVTTVTMLFVTWV